jgi:hypothetical protein
MRTTSTALGFDIGFFLMPTRSIASATYTTSSSIPTGSITAIATIANSNSNTLSWGCSYVLRFD